MRSVLSRRAAAFALALALAAPAAHAHELFGRGEEAVAALARLYAGASRAFPLTTFPASGRELAEAADSLAEEVPDLAGAVQDYEGRYLSSGSGAVSVEGAVAGDFSYRLETESFSLDPADTPFYRSLDAVRLFRYAEPALSGGAKLSLGGRAELAVRADIMRRVNDNPYSQSNWISGDAGTPIAIENNFVQEAYLWYDFDPLSVLFGRASAHFGPMRDSLMVSDRIPYLDQLRLDLPLGPAKLNFLAASLETRASSQEQAEIEAAYSTSSGDFEKVVSNTIKATSFLAIHRLEWAFPRVRLGIAGQCIVSRENNAYTLGDFFPVFSWHQGDLTPNNMCLLFDADLALFRDARLMAQFGFDDINAGDFGIGIGDSSIPTISAGILAFEYSPEIAGLQTDLYLEGGATHYLWGNFDIASDGTTDVYSYLARSIYRWRLYVDGDSIDLPLSSPYGPGAIWGKLEASTGMLWGCLRPSLSLLWISLNDEANLVTTKYLTDSSIANASRTETFAVGLGLEAVPVKYLKASITPIVFFQGGKAYGELTLSLNAGLPAAAASRGK